MNRPARYALNMIVATNQWFNALMGGDPDEMISARVGKAVAEGRAGWIVRSVAWLIDAMFGKGHCARAALGDTSEGRFETWKL